MAYCTSDNLNSEYGEENVTRYADLDGDSDASTIAARIAWQIANADATIDARLRRSDKSFRLPLLLADGTVPPVLRKVSVQLAFYGLSKARGFTDYDSQGRPISKFHSDYQEAMATLEQIAKGEIDLGV